MPETENQRPSPEASRKKVPPVASVTLVHAGPAPRGTMFWPLVPDGMDLRQLGIEMMHHGGWLFGGIARPGYGFDCAGLPADSTREAFSFGPKGCAIDDVFALAKERNSMKVDVLTLYVSPDYVIDGDERTSDEEHRKSHAVKIIEVFKEMRHALHLTAELGTRENS